jgi:hypothetical protein
MQKRSLILWATVLPVVLIAVWAAIAQKKEATIAMNAPELGRISFNRDFSIAIAKAKKSRLPLFVLFDEVPG